MNTTDAVCTTATPNPATLIAMRPPLQKENELRAQKQQPNGKAAAEPVFVLNSWKEIANYLSRGIRTVQRWERCWELPVHRVGSAKRKPVYAIVPELKMWMVSSSCTRALNESSEPRQRDGGPASDSMLLIARIYELAQAVSRNTRRQQQRIEALREQMAAIHARIEAGRSVRRKRAAAPAENVAQFLSKPQPKLQVGRLQRPRAQNPASVQDDNGKSVRYAAVAKAL
jgi:hypothetical protein